ncbi:MAG: acyl-CoA/acyl-ACP dehydrogenase, partial [Hyphomicrobiales bacterium]|nr:acyl-CoA/acyl-ACP dehydrogenase [Hyphomicrobiales bacterium]
MNAQARFAAPAASLADRADSVAATAARHADSVDRDARFPKEAIEAAREARLLGAMAPVSSGGEGASLAAMADALYRIGGACASTAMVVAMHQGNVACLARHAGEAAFPSEMLARVGADQWLLASSTTEGATGGAAR